MTRKPLVFVLVHGTFAQNAAWMEPDSVFVRGLREALGGRPNTIHVFRWSGTNSHSARAKAALELREFLKALYVSVPNTERFIVSHSHGGNIAVQAMRSETVQMQTSGIVTVGTPFISCRERSIEGRTKVLFWALSIPAYVAIFSAIVLPITFFLIKVDEHLKEVSKQTDLIGIIFNIGAAIATIAATRGLRMKLMTALTNWGRSCYLRTAEALNMQGELPPLLCATALDDEAGRWLGLLRAATNIANLTFGFAARYVKAALKVSGSIFLLAGLVSASIDKPWTQTAVIVAGLASILFVVAVPSLQLFTIFFPMLIRAHGLGFGGESLSDNWFSDILTTSTPVGRMCETLNISTPERKAHGLWHSFFFEDPAFAIFLADWTLRETLPPSASYPQMRPKRDISVVSQKMSE